MKLTPRLSGLLAAAALCAAAFQSSAQLTLSYTNAFDNDTPVSTIQANSAASWLYWWGSITNIPTMTWDATMDAATNPNSGSLKVSLPWAGSKGEQLFFGTWSEDGAYDTSLAMNGVYINNISFDIHVDPSSPANAAGNFGSLQIGFYPGPVTWSASAIALPLSATNGWTHITIPVPENTAGVANVTGISMTISTSSALNGTTLFWVDNIKTAATPIYTNAFNNPPGGWGTTGSSTTSWTYWQGVNPSYSAMSWSSNVDANANTNSGSLKVSIPWTSGNSAGSNLSQTMCGTFANRNSFDNGETTSGSNFQSILCSVHVDPSSPVNAAGNYGVLRIGLLSDVNGTWNGITWPASAVTLEASAVSGWTNIAVPIAAPGLSNVSGIFLEMQTYATNGGGLPGATLLWVDNLGMVANAVTGSTAPSFTSVSQSGGHMVMNGYNPEGGINLYYVMLSSPSLSLPLAQWTPLATNELNIDGTFSFTNNVNPSQPALYYSFFVTATPHYTYLGDNTYLTDGSDLGTQQAINVAGNGATVMIPAGIFNWTNGITASNAIHIAGAGSGALFGNSTTPLSVGTGAKTFVLANNSGFVTVTNGMTVTAYYTAAGEDGNAFGIPATNMTGTVTSFDGTNLTLNVTRVEGGPGTISWWTFGTASATIITNYCTLGAFTLNEPISGNLELSGLKVVTATNATSTSDCVDINGGGGLALIHDCWFEVANVGARAIESRCNHGLIYRCSFDNHFDSGIGNNGNGNNGEALTFKADGLTASWSNNATLGMADTGGTNNFYVEDCYEAGIWTGGTDFDDNSRVVIRHCMFDNSCTSSHGQETSPYGLRHFEEYNNTFIFVDGGLATFNLNWWLFLRGGTGVVFSNTMPAISSETWGVKSALEFCVMYPYRIGYEGQGCETNYPAPRQVGQSWSNGAPITDPVCFWANSELPAGNPGLEGYPANQPGSSCYADANSPPYNTTNMPPISDFLQAGRDFTNVAKVGYAPYTYPHPLRVP